MKQNVQIYLKNKRLTLFADENINVSSKATDINNISKIFTDISQTFTVPANNVNNAIFEHYYDISNDSTFNPNVRIPATIEVDTIPYKKGKIQLESILMKNKKPYSYKITFYGDLVQLDDLFKDDTLRVLSELKNYDHPYNDKTVFDAVTTSTFMNGDVLYPLISQRVWQYGSNNPENDIQNYPIKYTELKPALRLYSIIEAIESQYNIKFNSTFFKSAPFRNAYMWLSNGKDKLTRTTDDPVFVKFFSFDDLNNVQTAVGADNESLIVNTQYTKLSILGGSTLYRALLNFSINLDYISPESDGFRIRIYNSKAGGEYSLIYSAENVYEGIVSLPTITRIDDGTFTNEFKIAIEPLNGTIQGIVYTSINQQEMSFSTGSIIDKFGGATANFDLSTDIRVNYQIPPMKVKEFISGVIQMFNLVILPDGDNQFKIMTMDDYKKDGKVIDITKYVDINEATIERVKLYNSIIFKHQKQNTLLASKFRELNDPTDEISYGDLKSTYNINEKRELKVESPFEIIMFESLSNQSAGMYNTNLHIASAIGSNLEAVAVKPLIMFYNGLVDCANNPFLLESDYINTYNCFSNYDDLFEDQITTSLMFGTAINSFTFADTPKSLYTAYWKNYIENIYNRKQRTFKMSAYLPPSMVNNLKIQDKFIINDHRYTIEEFTTNLTTGECGMILAYDFPKFEDTEFIGGQYKLINKAQQYITFKVKTEGTWTASITSGNTFCSFVNSSYTTPTNGDGYITILFNDLDSAIVPVTSRSAQITVNIDGTNHYLTINQKHQAYV